MDNLEQLWCHSITIDEGEYGKLVASSFHEGIVCFITEFNYLGIYEEAKLDKSYTFLGSDIKVKHVYYLSMYDVIFLVTDNTLCVFNRNTLKNSICYETEKRIAAVSWNPMETLTVLIDENDEVTLFTWTGYSFQVKYKTHLNAAVPNSVYVGWGSQNTQFKGPKKLQHKETIEAEKITYSSPVISWRGNGEQFVVNFYKDGIRCLKVFDSNLNPLYISEEYTNLQSQVSFMGQGQCIACCATRNDINDVVIFEKNCKVKSRFEVPENKCKIKTLQYHPQMNILAVHSVDEKGYSYINIYLNTNAKWHLKQQLLFSPSREVLKFSWVNRNEPLNTICKLVVFTVREIEFHTFRFIVNRCPNTATVAVIDGKIVNFYKYDNKNIPPPMTYITLENDSPINRILFDPKILRCVLLDAKAQAKIFDLTEDSFGKLLLSGNLNMDLNISNFCNVIWNENGDIELYIECDSDKTYNSVFKNDSMVLKMTTIRKNPQSILLPYNDTNSLIYRKDLSEEYCKLIYLTKKFIKVNNMELEFDYALSSNREFYVNENVICTNVSSFFIYNDYLIFTHVDCKLYCVRLSQDCKLLYDILDLSKIYSREIEQGARIVCVNNAEPPKIVLQLPRGNLESIGCRLITVDIIEKLLNENQWEVAIDIMRTNRINWNVLVDLNPSRFCDHIEDFVKATKYCGILNSVVNNFNSTENFYENCWPKNKTITKYNKTEIVEKILKYLISTDCINNFSSIVSIQQKHFSVKLALSSIRDVYLTNPKSNDKICRKALNQLLLQAHLKDVLDAAYSFYNLEFLLFVYSNSGQDPRIYEPEIANLKTLDQPQLRYEMCIKGNNRKNAIKYLLRCKNYNETYVKDYIMKNKLERVAYKSLPFDHRHFKLVTVIYARHLSLKQNYIEAAIILKKIGLIEEALEEYKKGLNWVEVLHLIAELQYEENKKKDIIYELANLLLKEHRVDEAVQLLEHYNHDYKTAILTLVEHKAFNKAIALCRIYQFTTELDAVVIPNLKQYVNVLIEKVEEFEGRFNKYWQRLKSVRSEKLLKIESMALGMYNEDDDLYSETGSTISSVGSSRATSKSRISTLSSKNRRKEERKKIDLRENGYYEDIALIRALHILFTDAFLLGKEVRDICLITENGILESCFILHNKLSQLQESMKTQISEIWPDILAKTPDVIDNKTQAIIDNKEDLDPKYWLPPSEEILNIKWRLEIFE